VPWGDGLGKGGWERREGRDEDCRGGYSFGDYDVVAIYEAPGDTAAAAITLAFGAGGAVKTAKTTKQLSGQEWVESLRQAQSIAPRTAQLAVPTDAGVFHLDDWVYEAACSARRARASRPPARGRSGVYVWPACSVTPIGSIRSNQRAADLNRVEESA